MTDQDLTSDGEPVLTLQQVIRARMDERGWSYADLERLSHGALTRGRWQQLGSGVRMANFPEPPNIQIIADTLEVDVTAVVLAAAKTLGLDVRRRGPDFAQLLPAGTDRLSERMGEAIVGVIRAAVAETLEHDGETDSDAHGPGSEPVLAWKKSDAPSRRGAARNVGPQSAEAE